MLSIIMERFNLITILLLTPHTSTLLVIIISPRVRVLSLGLEGVEAGPQVVAVDRGEVCPGQ